MVESATSGADTSIAMRLAVNSIKTRFPSVSTVNTSTVFNWLQISPKEVILLDVRCKDEYDVSHIDGALRVNPDHNDIATDVGNTEGVYSGDTKVVCYCSLGYRSSAYAEALKSWLEKEKSRGNCLENPTVYNMEGSLFKWANERRPMVNDSGKTVFAHPYNSVFGKLLHKDLRRTKAKD